MNIVVIFIRTICLRNILINFLNILGFLFEKIVNVYHQFIGYNPLQDPRKTLSQNPVKIIAAFVCNVE